jgi:hypothetical protein
MDAQLAKKKEPSIESVLRRKFWTLVMSYALSGVIVIAMALFTGDPYGILFVLLLPVLFFLHLILVFQIVVCPYCGQSDPVGLMFAFSWPFDAPRSECPTCCRAMNKPFDPNFRSGTKLQ